MHRKPVMMHDNQHSRIRGSWLEILKIREASGFPYRSELDDLGGVDVVARANGSENFFARSSVEIQNCQRSSTSLISTQ